MYYVFLINVGYIREWKFGKMFLLLDSFLLGRFIYIEIYGKIK